MENWAEEIKKCKEDPFYFTVKYHGVEDTPRNREFFNLVQKAKKEGKHLILSKGIAFKRT